MDTSAQLSVIQEESATSDDEVGELSSLLQETATSIIRTILFFKDRGVIPFEYLCFLQRLSRDLTKPPPGLNESDLYSVEVDATGDWANAPYPGQPPASPQIEQRRISAEKPTSPLASRRRMAETFGSIQPHLLYAATSPPPVSSLLKDTNATGLRTGRFPSTSGPRDVAQGGVSSGMSATSPARMNVTPEALTHGRSTLSSTRMNAIPERAELNTSGLSPSWSNTTRTIVPHNRSVTPPARMDVTPETAARSISVVSPRRMKTTQGPVSLSRSDQSPERINVTRTIAPLSRSMTPPARMDMIPEAIARSRSVVSPRWMEAISGPVNLSRSVASSARMNRSAPRSRFPESPSGKNVTRNIRSSNKSERMDMTPGAVVLNRSLSSAASHRRPLNMSRISNDSFCPMQYEISAPLCYLTQLPDILEYEDFSPEFESTRIRDRSTFIE